MDKKIILYGTSTCPYCIRTKQFLKENNIVFQDIDVSSNQAEAQEMMRKSGQMGVPVIDIGGDIIVGFDRQAISEKLGI